LIIHSASLTATPVEDLTTTLMYTKLWKEKDQEHVNDLDLNQPDGTNINNIGVVESKGLGQEVDLVVLYDYTEDVQFGLNLGWFFPGKGIDECYREVAKQALLNCKVNF
jgi:hypothetical protein